MSNEIEEPAAFIPPPAERPPMRAPRMPRIDELPMPAQNEIRARRGEIPQEEHPESRRKSLLQRLASVGLGRSDQDEHEADAARRAGGADAAERLTGRPCRARPSHARIRSPNTPSARRRRGSTSTAGRPLCITRAKRISSTFRRSCAGRRTKSCPPVPVTIGARPADPPLPESGVDAQDTDLNQVS